MADLIIDCLLCYFDVRYTFVLSEKLVMFGLKETSDKKQSISGRVKVVYFPLNK